LRLSCPETADVIFPGNGASVDQHGQRLAGAGAVGRSADDLRTDMEDAGRWTVVEDELRTVLQSVAAS